MKTFWTVFNLYEIYKKIGLIVKIQNISIILDDQFYINTMKNFKLMSVMVAAALLLTNCKKETTGAPAIENKVPASIVVAEKNTAIYGKLTATWCGPCGAWGWTLNDEIITSTSDKAIPMGLYGSSTSNFTNATVNQWFTDFGGQSYPNFTVNGKNKTAFSSGGGIYTTTTKTDVLAAIDAFIATPVQASGGGNLTWTGQKLSVKSAIKCFMDQTGNDLYVGAYIIEDKAKSIQNSQTGEVEHHHVCRGSMSSANIYGVKFTGTLTPGTQTELSPFEFDVPSTWVKENIYVALVIWNKVGTKYNFVNAVKIK